MENQSMVEPQVIISGHANQIVDPYRLHFSIQYYTNFDAFGWRPFYREDVYGEIGVGLVRGDRATTIAMNSGYVYIFLEKGGEYELAQTYEVNNNQYHRIHVDENDVSHSVKIGSQQAYMAINNFFKENDLMTDNYVLVASNIALSKERLFSSDFALIKDPTDRGKNISITRSRLDATTQDTRSGRQIFEDYQKPGASVSLNAYDFKEDVIGGAEGFYIMLPHVPTELRRLNKRFCVRLNRYHSWLNGTERTKKAFICQAVRSVLNQDPGKESYINKAVLEKWRDEDSEQLRRNFFPVHYAVERLIDWLEDYRVKEVLRDYSYGTDDDQTAGVQLYHDGIQNLFHTEQGTKYLSKQYDDKDSYLAQSTRLLELKPEYVDKGAFSNFYVEIRKWNHVTFALMGEIVPVLVAKKKGDAIVALLEIAKQRAGFLLETIKVQPTPLSQVTVDVIYIERFLQKSGKIPNSKGGKAIINFLELGNVAFAVHGLIGSIQGEDGERIAKGIVNLVGAGVDLSANNWIVQSAFKNKYGVLKGTKVIYGLVIISGIVDCILGVWEARRAWKEGEVDVAIGWGGVALGGAIVATGAAAKILGGKITIGSGGALAEVGVVAIVAGLLVEGVGLAIVFFCNNDEIEDWLTQCEFGEKPQGKTLKQQIQQLNDILCKFEVEAEFSDIDMKFNNMTTVKLIVRPRVITGHSRITFSHIKALAYARPTEYLLGNRHDLATGMSGSKNPVLDLSNPHNCDIYQENGRIVRVETKVYYNRDSDELRWTAKLDINNGTLQGFTQNFVVTA